MYKYKKIGIAVIVFIGILFIILEIYQSQSSPYPYVYLGENSNWEGIYKIELKNSRRVMSHSLQYKHNIEDLVGKEIKYIIEAHQFGTSSGTEHITEYDAEVNVNVANLLSFYSTSENIVTPIKDEPILVKISIEDIEEEFFLYLQSD